MQEISRRDVLAAGMAGAAILITAPMAAEASDPDIRLREIVETYGGEFGPARKGA